MKNDFDIAKANDIDTFFFWESQTDYKPNQCRMRIYWITWEKAIVIATDLTDNPGRKVANVTKEIISFVNKIYDLAPNKIMLVGITSDGSKYDNPRHLKKHERNLKRKQQKLSRKQKGSNSRNKA
ncbi:MAG: hypothetical protein WBM44_13180, partial [Waterburya sp.]